VANPGPSVGGYSTEGSGRFRAGTREPKPSVLQLPAWHTILDVIGCAARPSWQAPTRRLQSGEPGRYISSVNAKIYLRQRGGRAALMRINIWIVLAILLALPIPAICVDDPTASVCER
jgi:hypothetical protein